MKRIMVAAVCIFIYFPVTAQHEVIYHVFQRSFFDSNGDAAGGSTLFAVISPGLALTNADFQIV